MIKRREVLEPASCLNRALPEEPLFVLLGRDVAAPAIIRAWAEMRVMLGKNNDTDEQIIEALALAHDMTEWRIATVR